MLSSPPQSQLYFTMMSDNVFDICDPLTPTHTVICYLYITPIITSLVRNARNKNGRYGESNICIVWFKLFNFPQKVDIGLDEKL